MSASRETHVVIFCLLLVAAALAFYNPIIHNQFIDFDDSSYILLFSKTGQPRLGATAEIFTRETIEQAYEVPFDMLKKREELYRKYLVELLKVRKK